MLQNIIILLTLAAAVILLVLAFNAYQETQYRKKIRKQFGHSDRDALLEENAVQVRDGETGTLNSFAPVEDDEEFEVPIKETKKASKQADLDDAFELAAEDAPATVPKVKVKSLSRVRFFAMPWTAAYQAPPSMGFSRQEYWSGVPLPSPILFYRCSFIYGSI